ncbi:thiamine ABC transporter substrate-binding protein [Pyrodictium abyssi]|uniref:Thiamine ABC transporter substrate binding subunit n=1 Tax=Pyrodictium abyssi TaxID=54256 RepID=A0ABN6ZRH7_9CREN|nr:thiamine ABC transporter substrate binding subunit [Pyrodictium abyssi]
MASRSLYFLVGVAVIAVLVAASYMAVQDRSGAKPAEGPAPAAAPAATATTMEHGEHMEESTEHTGAAAHTATATETRHESGHMATEAETEAEKETTTATAQAGGGKKLVVYVYEDFMAWGEDPELFDKLVENFTRETGIVVELRRFDGARNMVTQVIAESRAGMETADVVVGVDPVLLVELKSHGLVECYASPLAARELVEALDPEGCATPVDYGLIALVYDPGRLNETEKAMLSDGVTLDELVALAPRIVAEDPTQSSTGLNFLLYTIAVSELEDRDWRDLWRAMRDNGLMVAPSWGDAYDEFFREGSPRAIVVSYGTDPAYSAWYNAREGGEEKPSVAATVLTAGGEKIGWLQVEGAAIIKGAPMEEARRFIDWLLSREVQEEIPTSQWMLPASSDAGLPSFYRYALSVDSVDKLGNTLLPGSRVAGELEKWLRDWLGVMTG